MDDQPIPGQLLDALCAAFVLELQAYGKIVSASAVWEARCKQMWEDIKGRVPKVAWYCATQPGQFQVLVPSCYKLATLLKDAMPEMVQELQGLDNLSSRALMFVENGTASAAALEWFRAALPELLSLDGRNLTSLHFLQALWTNSRCNGRVHLEHLQLAYTFACRLSKEETAQMAGCLKECSERIVDTDCPEFDVLFQFARILLGATAEEQECHKRELCNLISRHGLYGFRQKPCQVGIHFARLQARLQNGDDQVAGVKHILAKLVRLDADVVEIAKRLPQNLTSISCDFHFAEKITDLSFAKLAERLPQNLTSLNLNFHSASQITDVSFAKLAERLPQNLTSLNLNFHSASQITDVSFAKLAERLPQNLTSLYLDFSWARGITDVSFAKLAERLPQNLTSISCDFHSASQITDVSFAKLAERLPQNLTSLNLNFHSASLITDASFAKLAERLPQNLTSLSLDFSSARGIADVSFAKLAERLPQNLTSLNLNFHSASQITDVSFAKLAERLPQNLTWLYLDFSWARGITDVSFAKLAERLPQNLTSLSLDFEEKITDVSFAKRAERLPQYLTSLSLGFHFAEKITDVSFAKLAERLPQNLTSLSFHFSWAEKITVRCILCQAGRKTSTESDFA